MRKLLLGADPSKVASPDAMQNPASLAFFVDFAKTLYLVGPAHLAVAK